MDLPVFSNLGQNLKLNLIVIYLLILTNVWYCKLSSLNTSSITPFYSALPTKSSLDVIRITFRDVA